MGEQIKVIIDKDGTLVLKVRDASGAQCLTLTESFEREIGRVLDRQRTRDFFRSGRVRVKNEVHTKS